MMSILAKFDTGFALKENGRTVYIIPNSSEESEFLPLDLIVLETSETVGRKPSRRKLYEAFKIHVTKSSLENAFETVDTGCSGRILKDAIGGSKLTTLELLHEDDGSCLKVSYQERNNASKIEGSLRLEKIELFPSVGSMLEAVVMNLMRTAQENSALRAGARELNLKQEKLEALFQELVHGKSKLEDRLVRAFTKVLNAKKRRIRELKKELTALKKRREDLSSHHSPSASKRKRKAKGSEIISSSGSETEVFSDRDGDVTDYDAETDVHESDEGGPETRISNVSNITNASDKIAPETPSTSNCKKNLFSGHSKKTEKVSGRKFTGKCPANLFDSQSDSSQDINKLPEAGPSEVSQDEKLGPNSKENVTCDDDEDMETQFISVGDISGNQPSKATIMGKMRGATRDSPSEKALTQTMSRRDQKKIDRAAKFREKKNNAPALVEAVRSTSTKPPPVRNEQARNKMTANTKTYQQANAVAKQALDQFSALFGTPRNDYESFYHFVPNAAYMTLHVRIGEEQAYLYQYYVRAHAREFAATACTAQIYLVEYAMNMKTNFITNGGAINADLQNYGDRMWPLTPLSVFNIYGVNHLESNKQRFRTLPMTCDQIIASSIVQCDQHGVIPDPAVAIPDEATLWARLNNRAGKHVSMDVARFLSCALDGTIFALCCMDIRLAAGGWTDDQRTDYIKRRILGRLLLCARDLMAVNLDRIHLVFGDIARCVPIITSAKEAGKLQELIQYLGVMPAQANVNYYRRYPQLNGRDDLNIATGYIATIAKDAFEYKSFLSGTTDLQPLFQPASLQMVVNPVAGPANTMVLRDALNISRFVDTAVSANASIGARYGPDSLPKNTAFIAVCCLLDRYVKSELINIPDIVRNTATHEMITISKENAFPLFNYNHI